MEDQDEYEEYENRGYYIGYPLGPTDDIGSIKCHAENYSSMVSYHRGAMHGSKFRKQAKFNGWYNNKYNRKFVVTLFSGGTLSCTLQEYQTCLTLIAEDIAKHIPMTINEIAYNVDGFRPYFELDYRKHIPDFEIIKIHAKLAQDIIHAKYPLCQSDMALSKCPKKIKFCKKTQTDYIASGVHLVFPHCITNTDDLKAMIVLLNIAIAKDNVLYDGVVDGASVKTDQASLRQNCSHKISECTNKMCIHRPTKKIKYFSNVECSLCYKGRIVEYSAYQLLMLFKQDGQILDYTTSGHDDISILDELKMTSIIRQDGKVSAFISKPIAKSVSTVFNKVLCLFNQQYIHSKITAVHHKAKNTIQLNTDSTFCCYNQTCHSTNRVYFMISLDTKKIRARCYNIKCKQKHSYLFSIGAKTSKDLIEISKLEFTIDTKSIEKELKISTTKTYNDDNIYGFS